MQRKGLYYELVTAQTEKEQEKEKEKDIDSDKENEIEEELVKQFDGSNKNRKYRQSRRMSIMLRRSSIVSTKSVTSEVMSETGNDIGKFDHLENESRFKMPFILKIAQLNSPEWLYLLIGGIASLVFGGLMPVCFVKNI
jgi:hypothetical protein